MRRIDLRALALDAATTEPGMLGVNPEKARALAKTLERQGFKYRFPIEPPKPEMVRHGFVKYGLGEGEGREREWKILNERKNGYHNVTVLDAAAKDAYGYANHNVKKCPGTVYKGGCEGRGRPVPGHVYCAECIKANESRAKDDREYPMPVHRLTGRNPDRCAQCGRPQSDLIHNCTNRFATDRRAKDQVPQDCFDAQILGV